VTLWFDVVNSPSLEQEQKELIMRRLENRIGKDGMLRVISQQTRSQEGKWGIGGGAVCGVDAGCAKAGPDKKEDASEQGGEASAAGGEEATRHFET